MPHADQATIDLLTDYFAAMKAKDLSRLGEYYAEDITLTFANAPTITGREAALAQITTLLGKVKSLAGGAALRGVVAPLPARRSTGPPRDPRPMSSPTRPCSTRFSLRC
jgi:hypothetical protein